MNNNLHLYSKQDVFTDPATALWFMLCGLGQLAAYSCCRDLAGVTLLDFNWPLQ